MYGVAHEKLDSTTPAAEATSIAKPGSLSLWQLNNLIGNKKRDWGILPPASRHRVMILGPSVLQTIPCSMGVSRYVSPGQGLTPVQ